MPAEAFRHWRKRLGLKQKDAADLLGLKKRMIQYYETGSRDGKEVSIPKSIRLACFALEKGVGDYNGERIIKQAPIALEQPHPIDSDVVRHQPPPLPKQEHGRPSSGSPDMIVDD